METQQHSGSRLQVPMQQEREAMIRQAAGTLPQNGRAVELDSDVKPAEDEVYPGDYQSLTVQIPTRSPAAKGTSLPDSSPRSQNSQNSQTPSKSSAVGQDTDMLKSEGFESRASFGSKQSSIVSGISPRRREELLIHTKFIKADVKPDEDEDSWIRGKIRAVVESRACETCIAAIVLLNFGLTMVETDASAKGETPALWIQHLLVVCFACVILEFCIRLYVERKDLFGSPWTWLDMFVIFSGFLDYVIQMTGWGGIAVVRTLRIFRLLRIVRVILHLKFFHELTKLLQMMGSCFRTLFWSFLLMGFVMTIWGTIAVEVVHPYVIELIDIHGEFEDCPRCRTAFSCVLNADLTLFQTIIAGDSWGKIALPVIAYKPWTGIIFLGSLLTLVFGVLNLIVAVVVDTSAEVRAKDIIGRGFKLEYEEVEEKKALTKMFNKIDLDKNGSLSYEELKEGARKNTEFRHWLRVLDIDSDDLKRLFEMVDEDNNGAIEPHEFIEQMYRFKNAESKTASRFVKHLLTRLERTQAGFEEKLQAKLENVRSKVDKVTTKVDGCESVLTSPTVKEGLARSMLTAGLRNDEVLHQRLSEQMDSMESAFQQATREALEIALRTAADTTKHLLEASNAANRVKSIEAAKLPTIAVEDTAKKESGEEAQANGTGGFWTARPGWLTEILSPRSCASLPSEHSKAECPPTAVRRGAEADRDDELADGVLALEAGGDLGDESPRAAPEVADERGACGSLEPPCQELRGPNGASAGPLKPFLPGGFQSRAPCPVLTPCDNVDVEPRRGVGAGLCPDLERGGDADRGSDVSARKESRGGTGRRPTSRSRPRPKPPSSGA